MKRQQRKRIASFIINFLSCLFTIIFVNKLVDISLKGKGNREVEKRFFLIGSGYIFSCIIYALCRTYGKEIRKGLGYDDSGWDRLSKRERNEWRKEQIKGILVYRIIILALVSLATFIAYVSNN